MIAPNERLFEDILPIKRVTLDSKKLGAPSLASTYLVVLDDVLSPTQCKNLLYAAEMSTNTGWKDVVEMDEATGTQVARKCQRIMWDSPELVAELWSRIKSAVPELYTRVDDTVCAGKKQLTMTRLNERMRFLKYGEGEYFEAHPDCYYETEDGRERSYITLLLFLSDQVVELEGQGHQGGALTFHSKDMKEQFDITPKAGRILLFEQETLLHSGQRVMKGTKYAMRTDLMYDIGS